MSAEKISLTLMNGRQGFANALLSFMHASEDQAQHIIQSIEQSFRDVCGRSYEANDPFASFAARVISGDFSFVVKEVASTILRYVAWDVNRFSAQRLVERIIRTGVDPLLEEILKE